MQKMGLFFKVFIFVCFLTMIANSQEDDSTTITIVDTTFIENAAIVTESDSILSAPDSSKEHKIEVAILYPQVLGNKRIDSVKLDSIQREMQTLVQKSFSAEFFRFSDSSVTNISGQFKGCIKACLSKEIKKLGLNIPYTVQNQVKTVGKEMFYDIGVYDINGEPVSFTNFTGLNSQEWEAFFKSSAVILQKTPLVEAIQHADVTSQELHLQGQMKSVSSGLPNRDQKENSMPTLTIIGAAMAVLGGGLAAYGLYCEKSAVNWYENHYQKQTGESARNTWKSIQDAQKVRNISYGLGSVLFVSGLGVMIFF